jgi:hypothetical protein
MLRVRFKDSDSSEVLEPDCSGWFIFSLLKVVAKIIEIGTGHPLGIIEPVTHYK